MPNLESSSAFKSFPIPYIKNFSPSAIPILSLVSAAYHDFIKHYGTKDEQKFFKQLSLIEHRPIVSWFSQYSNLWGSDYKDDNNSTIYWAFIIQYRALTRHLA